MNCTPTKNSLTKKLGQFSNLAEALDYAARGDTGFNFYDRRGQLTAVLSYRDLRDEALAAAARLRGLGLAPGSRVALVAETGPEFLHAFFGCQYSGMVPVPLPISIHAGSHDAYVAQLRGMLESCKPSVAMASDGYSPYLDEASTGMKLSFVGTFDELRALEAGPNQELASPALAYLQYTSGSTRFPRGVMITQEALAENLRGILTSLAITDNDRATSWLPYYHDMGLVGLVLAPIAAQVTVDFLPTHEFARAPLRWLSMISENQATLSFSPPFGYELCTRRLRPEAAASFSLAQWRVAGIGAEQIRPTTLEQFADAFAASGFQPRSFLPSYGMAECSLALSFPPLDTGVVVDEVDADLLQAGEARQTEDPTAEVRQLVKCGRPLVGHEIEIRDSEGKRLSDRRPGVIFVRGPSVMCGYFEDPQATRESLSPDGWLNTGDIGYWTGESLVITGRHKDLLIVKGRNIWPHDLEVLAEEELELRIGDALAFPTEGPDGDEAVIVVQCRESDEDKREVLIGRLRGAVRRDFGIDCGVDFVAPGVLPRTSSGKLSRSAARLEYEERQRMATLVLFQPEAAPVKAAQPATKSAAKASASSSRKH